MQVNTWREALFAIAQCQDKRDTNWSKEVPPEYQAALPCCVRDGALVHAAQRGCGVSPWGTPKAAWTWAWAPCSGWYCWSSGGTKWAPEVPASLSLSVIMSRKWDEVCKGNSCWTMSPLGLVLLSSSFWIFIYVQQLLRVLQTSKTSARCSLTGLSVLFCCLHASNVSGLKTTTEWLGNTDQRKKSIRLSINLSIDFTSHFPSEAGFWLSRTWLWQQLAQCHQWRPSSL